MTPLQNLEHTCVDDWPNYHGYRSMQVDVFQQRLLYLEVDCNVYGSSDSCDYDLSTTPLGISENQPLYPLYRPDCYSDEEYCPSSGGIWAMYFDPADPDHRVLLLTWNYETSEHHIDSLDLTTGAITPVVGIQLMPGTYSSVRCWASRLTPRSSAF